MIVKSGEADRYVERPPKALVAALIFGPDQGLVRERAEKLAGTVVSDLRDPFRVAELDEAALSVDKARLADEAAAISMMGGRRVVRVRGAGNAVASVFDIFLENPKGDALVIVEAGDLAKSSSLRKAFEGAGNAAAIQCYSDNAQSISHVLRDALKAEGLTIGAEALDDAVARLGVDRGITRRETEKLVLYMHGKKHVEFADVRAVMGDEAEVRTDEICDAAGEGDLPRLDVALERLWSEDAAPAAILRPALSHFQRLLQVKAGSLAGESVDAAMKRGWPQIHFTRTTSFKAQLSRWSEETLQDACDLLFETEALTRTTAIPAEVVTSRALFTIAAMVRRR